MAAMVSSRIIAVPIFEFPVPASARAEAVATQIAAAETCRSIDVATVTRPVLGIPALQEEPRFFVAFLVQVMEQRRVGRRGQLAGQFLDARKERPQIRLGLGR